MINTAQKKWQDIDACPRIEIDAISGFDKGCLSISGLSSHIFVKKRWGYEKIYQNNSLYCMKLLTIFPYSSTSMHFHLEKHETLLNITHALLMIDIIKDKVETTIEIRPFKSYVIAPGLPHRLRAEHTLIKLIESSTTSKDQDSIRLPYERN